MSPTSRDEHNKIDRALNDVYELNHSLVRSHAILKLNSFMKTNLEKIAAWATIIGTLVAIYALFFGDNVYQQKTGQSIYNDGLSPAAKFSSLIPTETATPFQTSSAPILLSSKTPQNPTPVSVETDTPRAVPSPFPELYDPNPESDDFHDHFGIPMRLVPGGSFYMGNNGAAVYDNPEHTVYIDAFYIDKYEITNFLYANCVKDGKCQLPEKMSSTIRPNYYGNSLFDNYPVVYVNWYMAQTYCEWRGARLPTEAEWEKAARGTNRFAYPWGSQISCASANYGGCNKDTTVVGKYRNDPSPYGIFDMAGNVMEWVNSLLVAYPYNGKDGRENQIAASKDLRVLRGGFWNDDGDNVTTYRRDWSTPDIAESITGFRCARSAP